MTAVVLFDIDGTLVNGRTWKAILAHPDIPRARTWRLYMVQIPRWFLFSKLGMMGEAQFRAGWTRGLARLVRGFAPSQLDALGAWVAQEYLRQGEVHYRADVVEKLEQHKAEGARVVLVSGILQPVSAQIAAHLGVEVGLGSALELENGVCTGRLRGAPCAGPQKLEAVRAYMPEIDLSTCAAYADSISDAALLEAAGRATAVYPDAALGELAAAKGWAVYP